MNKAALASFCVVLSISSAFAQSRNEQPSTAPAQERLKFALVLTRHGVRSPTWTNARLDEYAQQPWPEWPVAPGVLTPHGKQLMVLFGGYYRAYLTEKELISGKGCVDASHIYIDADTDERTITTGHGLADGLAPGCNLPVHSMAQEQQDPLFHPIGKLGSFDTQLAFSALAGRLGNDPSALVLSYQLQLERMRLALFPSIEKPSEIAERKKDLLSIKPSITSRSGDHLAELKGPLSTAATFAENLQLEYLEGMPDSQVGWGRVNEAGVRELMALHAASSDLVQRTPYIARAQGSNLMAHILHTLQQAERNKAVAGAVGTPSDHVVFLVGHDTNIENIAALLDAHWLVNGYQRDDAAPGGALVFELWQNKGGPDTIRLYYLVQSPDQMRRSLPLSLATPPTSAMIFLPGCSQAGHDAPCTWGDFEKMVER